MMTSSPIPVNRMTSPSDRMFSPSNPQMIKPIKLCDCQAHLTRVQQAEPEQACRICRYLPGHSCDLFFHPTVAIHCIKCCEEMQEDSIKWIKMMIETRGGEEGRGEEGGRDA